MIATVVHWPRLYERLAAACTDSDYALAVRLLTDCVQQPVVILVDQSGRLPHAFVEAIRRWASLHWRSQALERLKQLKDAQRFVSVGLVGSDAIWVWRATWPTPSGTPTAIWPNRSCPMNARAGMPAQSPTHHHALPLQRAGLWHLGCGGQLRV